MKHIMAIYGAENPQELPGIDKMPGSVELRYAFTVDELREAAQGADMMFLWSGTGAVVQQAWSATDNLRWIHQAGAGVGTFMFDELIESDVVLTNGRGIFDRPMAEYALGLILAFATKLPETVRQQDSRTWESRLIDPLLGESVLVVGVGSIGREIGVLLDRFGMRVDGVGRQARETDPTFGRIYAVDDLDDRLAEYDNIIVIVPSTPATYRLFGAQQFARMKRTARFINMARGEVVDEAALIEALQASEIAAAGLDVFEQEPLPQTSPLWEMPNVIVSPHMSGDSAEAEAAMIQCLLDNVNRYIEGKPLNNVVDKALGFVPST